MRVYILSFSILIFRCRIALGCFCDCCSSCFVDCKSYQKIGHTTSGVYHIIPKGTDSGYDVYCDMTTDNGGWLVFQRRFDGSENFYRGWKDYEEGFGNASREYWLGLDPLKKILKQGYYELRIDLTDWEGNTTYAKYRRFDITDYKEHYKLTAMMYSGTAGDSMEYHHGQMFSTHDKDNDEYSSDCAQSYYGAWWYKSCKLVNLNGRYCAENPTSHDDGVQWYHWRGDRYSVKTTEMKIRRA